jgi:hypothetical protein
MMERAEPNARARRQARVAKIVWGSLFVVMGVLFTLHDMGRIDLGEPKSEYGAEHAVDGDPQTRWSSVSRDQEWLTVDLGAVTALSRIRLNWEAAYARDYELQVSSDGVQWTTVRRVTGGAGGVEEQAVGASARYVRMMGIRRATPYGYSLWELQVFDSSGALVSQGKPVMASSLEGQSPFMLWIRFWPLLLVAGGLPLLLAPTSDTSQVVGLVLAAEGVCLQLQALGLIAWELRKTSSVLLIVVGILILLQSRRRSERANEGGAGSTGDAS